MGYDLFYANLTDDDQEHLTRVANEAIDRYKDDPLYNVANPMHAIQEGFEAMRTTGMYERASMHVMAAYCHELRAQGADKLADALDRWENLESELILSELAGVSVVPTRPPDHEHFTAMEREVPELARATTARGALASMSDSHWAFIWSRFVTFLVRAAAFGGGVTVS